ncbi:glucuronate isomerase [Ruegeria sp. ANG-S4]|uniref:glucuronate isomerase n=1 Tax=Ruegeria sp. ANG-S4 TaxID=1577904 RepID=UPI00057DB338|nr:glucuronate isomerase [Ruegeria sp. ANG-S4]KIC47646.1 glucuronate isomerase [Ruegeria sp. ANG-S4]
MTFNLKGMAEDLYIGIKDLPIVSPHGHCDPKWFATDAPFPNPAELLVVPDHYVFRMLFSQGVSLTELGVGKEGAKTDPRSVFRTFAAHWDLFLGTPTRVWMSYVLRETLGISQELSPQSADAIYDQISEKLARPEFRPRALFDKFDIEVLATTDSALDDLAYHTDIRQSGWGGRVVPTFRPDGVLDGADPEFLRNLKTLEALTNCDLGHFDGYLNALRQRRAFFVELGCTATDHGIEQVHTEWLDDPDAMYQRLRRKEGTPQDARRFYGHMLIEMAQMSVGDGLTMQIHAGSKRNTNHVVMREFGRDKGADIPIAMDWVNGFDALLNRVGNNPDLRVILFTLDEGTYARELAPMAGHWPCLRIGPPWWFHDSPAGIARYFDQVVETAGYCNLAGFNDDTRAFLSIPARHDLWRRGVALHLADQVSRGYFGKGDAEKTARLLTTDLARQVYGLQS